MAQVSKCGIGHESLTIIVRYAPILVSVLDSISVFFFSEKENTPAVCVKAVPVSGQVLKQKHILFTEYVFLFSTGAPARTRTWNNGSEDRYDIRFTTGANEAL